MKVSIGNINNFKVKFNLMPYPNSYIDRYNISPNPNLFPIFCAKQRADRTSDKLCSANSTFLPLS